MSLRYALPCGCRITPDRPERMLSMCAPCTAEFTARHAQALADYRARYAAPTVPGKVSP